MGNSNLPYKRRKKDLDNTALSNQIGILTQDKADKKDVIYLSDYIANYDKTETVYENCDAAFASALSDCKSGGVLVLPVGTIKVNSTITISKPVTITGGIGSAVTMYGANDLFVVNCNDVHFINIKLEHSYYWNTSNYDTMKNGNYRGIRFQTGRRHLVDKCTIVGFSTNIHFVNCDFFTVSNNYIIKAFNYGVLVENQGNPDSGDSLIHGNVFNGGVTDAYQAESLIKQISGGGLKISDNKLLTGKIGIHVGLTSGVRTGVLIITGNSVEGQRVSCLKMNYETGATNSFFVRSTITSNEFLGNLCTGDAVILDGSVIPYSMKDIVFNDNIIADVPNTLNCLYVNGVSNIKISDNELVGGLNGIYIQASTQNIQIHDNLILNATTAIRHIGYASTSLNKLSNIKHTSFVDFTNNSLYGTVNTMYAAFGSSSALAKFKLTVEIQGSINTPAAEQFYVRKEYMVYNTSNSGTYNSFSLISSTTTGLPITADYNADGNVKIKRADTYADTTYAITGTVKATVEGMPYNVKGNVVS